MGSCLVVHLVVDHQGYSWTMKLNTPHNPLSATAACSCSRFRHSLPGRRRVWWERCSASPWCGPTDCETLWSSGVTTAVFRAFCSLVSLVPRQLALRPGSFAVSPRTHQGVGFPTSKPCSRRNSYL